MDSTTKLRHQAMPRALQSMHIQKRIKPEIILGAPSLGCLGVGICKVMAYGADRKYPCSRVMAWIAATETGKIRMSFLKSDMSPRERKRHFGWMLFQVYEAYQLPTGIVQAIGLEAAAIPPGIYSVLESPRFLTVDF